MQRDIRPAWLVRLAEELGGLGAGRGQPRNTNLRCAVSTAYYAVFHRISLATARSALPNAEDKEIFGLARHISHGAIKQVCAYVAGKMPPAHLESTLARLRGNEDLSAVASTFIELQQQREDADYNHLADFTRGGVLGMVGRARRAVDLVDEIEATDDCQAFLGLVGLRASVGSGR